MAVTCPLSDGDIIRHGGDPGKLKGSSPTYSGYLLLPVVATHVCLIFPCFKRSCIFIWKNLICI